jgi:cobalt-zinc-cadmium efflux system membrane fusion protein
MLKRRNVAVSILVIVLAATGLTGCGGNRGGPPAVVISKAVGGAFAGGTVVSGKVEALVSANVISKISGKVAEITVDVGSTVNAGDLLVRLDADEMAAAVQLAEASLQKTRESDLPSLRNQAQTNLTSTEATYKNAEAEYERSKALLSGSVISRQAFDQVEKSYLLAKSAYDSAKSNLDIVENSTIPDTIRQAEAQLTQARANYANNIITSPISGVVTARNINPGELASNNNSVVSLVNLDKVVVRVDVGENFINTMKDGSEVAVKVSAASEASFKGTVTNIALAANPVTKAYPVKIEIPNPEHVLKPGMFAEVVLKGNSVEGIMVPREAVVKSGEKDAVWVVSEGAARKREVVAGASDGKNVIISSGLTVGEDVITSSQEALTDGGVVDIAKTGS